MPAATTAAAANSAPNSAPDAAPDAALRTAPGSRRLRVAVVTENFLPKVDGVTRTLARLLEYLAAGGHRVLVLGPATGVVRHVPASARAALS